MQVDVVLRCPIYLSTFGCEVFEVEEVLRCPIYLSTFGCEVLRLRKIEVEGFVVCLDGTVWGSGCLG